MLAGFLFAVLSGILFVGGGYSGFEELAGLFRAQAFLALGSCRIILGGLLLLTRGLVLLARVLILRVLLVLRGWIVGLVLLVLLLLLLFLLLLFEFFLGKLQVHFRIGVAGAGSQAFFIRISGLLIFFLHQVTIAQVVPGVGLFVGSFGGLGRLVEKRLRSLIISLPVKRVSGIVLQGRIARFLGLRFPVGLFGLLIIRSLVGFVALALQLMCRLGR